jgi:electron transport complex protein RnfD
MYEQYLQVSASPHLHDRTSVASVMWPGGASLVPALIVSVSSSAGRPLWLTMLGVVAAVVTEAAIQKLRGVTVCVADGSAVVTGILVAFNLNVASPWWLPVVGSVFAIGIGKQVFGGLGHNPMNPALLARAFLVASWPTLTTSGFTPTALWRHERPFRGREGAVAAGSYRRYAAGCGQGLARQHPGGARRSQ